MNSDKQERNLSRALSLNSVRDWCMRKISLHSLEGEHANAQAITEEHMEILMNVNPDEVLWMKDKETL